MFTLLFKKCKWIPSKENIKVVCNCLGLDSIFIDEIDDRTFLDLRDPPSNAYTISLPLPTNFLFQMLSLLLNKERISECLENNW